MILHAARFLLAALVLATAACARASLPTAPTAVPPAPDPVEERRSSAMPRFERLGRDTFIYRLEWLRADETVETLRQLLEQDTGREVVLVPQEETNAILFRVLPRDPDNPRRFSLDGRSTSGSTRGSTTPPGRTTRSPARTTSRSAR